MCLNVVTLHKIILQHKNTHWHFFGTPASADGTPETQYLHCHALLHYITVATSFFLKVFLKVKNSKVSLEITMNE
jgi:hypothetical protein